MNTVGVQQREATLEPETGCWSSGSAEAGGRIAADLAAAGVEVRGFDPDPARDVRSILRASDAASAAIGCDVVLSVNSAKAALGAAEAALPAAGDRHLRRREHGLAGAEARARGARRRGGASASADVALLGPVPTRGLSAPVLVVRSRRTGFRGSLRAVGHAGRGRLDEAGGAAALEARAVGLHEGLAAAVVESMQAAEADVAAPRGSSRRSSADRLVVPRAGTQGEPEARGARVDEMEAARDLLLDLGRAADRDRERGQLAGLARSRIDRVETMATRGSRHDAHRPRGRARSCAARTTCTSTSPRTCRRGGSTTSSLARRFAEVGLAGFGLKSHYTSTAERAQVVSAVVPGVAGRSGRSRSTRPSAG